MGCRKRLGLALARDDGFAASRHVYKSYSMTSKFKVSDVLEVFRYVTDDCLNQHWQIQFSLIQMR